MFVFSVLLMEADVPAGTQLTQPSPNDGIVIITLRHAMSGAQDHCQSGQ
jgi:hypothetical protein